MIEKQIKIGNHLRQVKKTKMENRKKVATVKRNKESEQLAVPLKTKLYGGLEFPNDDEFGGSTTFS